MEKYEKEILTEKLRLYFENDYNPEKRESLKIILENYTLNASEFLEIYESLRPKIVQDTREFGELYSRADTLLVSIKERLKKDSNKNTKEIKSLIRKTWA